MLISKSPPVSLSHSTPMLEYGWRELIFETLIIANLRMWIKGKFSKNFTSPTWSIAYFSKKVWLWLCQCKKSGSTFLGVWEWLLAKALAACCPYSARFLYVSFRWLHGSLHFNQRRRASNTSGKRHRHTHVHIQATGTHTALPLPTKRKDNMHAQVPNCSFPFVLGIHPEGHS